MKFKGKVTVITGAGQGIGSLFARVMSQEGSKVVIADINEEAGTKVANEITARGQEALFVPLDVSDESSCEAMARKTVDTFGRVDILVNNASVFSTLRMKPMEEISFEEWDHVIRVNLGGVFLCTKAIIPFMKTQKKGKIVNMSSAAFAMGRPFYIHYVSSKAAVVGFTRALAREVGDYGIHVNCITPGATKTEIPRDTVSPEQMQAMINQRCIKREQVPDDLVGALMFLASEESDFITGQTINIDGGLTMH